MPDPLRLLNTLTQAIRLFRETPGRSGRLQRIEDGFDVLVAGDLHGNVENFRALLLKADLARSPGRHLILQELIHGPSSYPVGGDKSHQLVDLVAALKCQFPRQVHYLPGNHELAQAMGQQIAKGDLDYNAHFREGVGAAYGAEAGKIYHAYVELFQTVPLAIRTRNRVFLSHSLPSAARLPAFDPALLELDHSREEDLRYGGALHSLLWGRDTKESTAVEFLGRVDADWLITGHIPCEKGMDTPNTRQIIVDCMGLPACYCLFPLDHILSREELLRCVGTL